MIRKYIVPALFLVFAHCIWGNSASAQDFPLRGGCYNIGDANNLGIEIGVEPPKLAILLVPAEAPGLFGLSTWALPLANCAPFAASEEVCLTCATAATPMAGHPISLTTGNTYIQQTDLRVPGLAGGMSLSRIWNSKWPSTQSNLRIGMFGPNWRSTYEERVFVGADKYLKYSRSDGSFWSLAYVGGGDRTRYAVAAPANQGGGVGMKDGGAVWTFTSQSGEQRVFDMVSGYLQTITDRHGNKTQLTYDSGRLVTVTDPASRHLYFTYSDGANARVTAVTSDVGISLSYAYDNFGRLIQVTNPDRSTISFEYDDQSLITAVKDAQGKFLESHTYDAQGRGLTSSRANGVEAVTVSYPQP